MANIPDFTGESFDDAKELRRELTRVLRELNRDIKNGEIPYLGKNVLLAWVDDGKTVIDKGYKVADGSNGTFNPADNTIIYIQKV